MNHIRISHDPGVTYNWQTLPRPIHDEPQDGDPIGLAPDAVLLYVGDNIAPVFEECAGKQGDPYPYDRVVHLLSPTVSSLAARSIFAEADVRGESVMRSANDAFIRNPDLKSLRVIVWNAVGFPGGSAGLEAFVTQYYPPVPTIEYRMI